LAAFGGVAVCWVLAGVTGHATNFSKLTYLKFNRPVALPGVVLGPGEYAFELVNPMTSRNVVRVSNKLRTNTYAMTITRPVHRPKALDAKAVVTLGEARPGEAVPIKAWFPIGESTGYEFIY
jgi:hypothetical protein